MSDFTKTYTLSLVSLFIHDREVHDIHFNIVRNFGDFGFNGWVFESCVVKDLFNGVAFGRGIN